MRRARRTPSPTVPASRRSTCGKRRSRRVFEAMIQRHRQSEMIRFHLPADAVERVAFAYSPLFESVLSLHVLVEPGHHSLQHDWVRRMRYLPDGVRRDVRTFAFAYRSYI